MLPKQKDKIKSIPQASTSCITITHLSHKIRIPPAVPLAPTASDLNNLLLMKMPLVMPSIFVSCKQSTCSFQTRVIVLPKPIVLLSRSFNPCTFHNGIFNFTDFNNKKYKKLAPCSHCSSSPVTFQNCPLDLVEIHFLLPAPKLWLPQ